MLRILRIAAAAVLIAAFLYLGAEFVIIPYTPAVELVPIHDGSCVCDGLDPHCDLAVTTYDLVDLPR